MSILYAVETSSLAQTIVAYFDLTRSTDTGRVTMFEGDGAACVVAGARPTDIAYAIGRTGPDVCIVVALDATHEVDGAATALVAAAQWVQAKSADLAGFDTAREAGVARKATGHRPGLYPDLLVSHDMREITTSQPVVYELLSAAFLYLSPHEVSAVLVSSHQEFADAAVEVVAYGAALSESVRPSRLIQAADAFAAEVTERLGLSASQSAKLLTAARGSAAGGSDLSDASRVGGAFARGEPSAHGVPSTADERRRAFQAVLAQLRRDTGSW